MNCSGVRACAVVGKPDAARGELPVAFVEADSPFDEAGPSLDAGAITAVLRERLASFKVPKEIRFVESLPRNAMGKIDKPALRKMLSS